MHTRGIESHPSEPGVPEFSGRIAVLSLFGMMNWIYTWHNPRVDADASALARQMAGIFLNGLLGARKRSRARRNDPMNQ